MLSSRAAMLSSRAVMLSSRAAMPRSARLSVSLLSPAPSVSSLSPVPPEAALSWPCPMQPCRADPVCDEELHHAGYLHAGCPYASSVLLSICIMHVAVHMHHACAVHMHHRCTLYSHHACAVHMHHACAFLIYLPYASSIHGSAHVRCRGCPMSDAVADSVQLCSIVCIV